MSRPIHGPCVASPSLYPGSRQPLGGGDEKTMFSKYNDCKGKRRIFMGTNMDAHVKSHKTGGKLRREGGHVARGETVSADVQGGTASL